MEGFEEGEICNRDNCKGVISIKEIEGGCSCHINPPCSYCTTPKECCPECGWDVEEEQNTPVPFILVYTKKIEPSVYSYMYCPKPPRYKGDDLKPIWNVNQYFDEIYEHTIAKGLTKEQAENKVAEFKRSIYTKWDISKNDNKY